MSVSVRNPQPTVHNPQLTRTLWTGKGGGIVRDPQFADTPWIGKGGKMPVSSNFKRKRRFIPSCGRKRGGGVTAGRFAPLLCAFFLTISVSCIKDGGKPELRIKKSETFYYSFGEPPTLHPIKSTDTYAQYVHNYILESLLVKDFDTYQFRPYLAEKWSESRDGMTFSFQLRKDLRWSDGKPLTAHDVKFSLDAYKNPNYGGIHYLPYFENIKSAEVKDSQTVVFKAKKPYFKNLEVIAGMDIIPKHIYEGPVPGLSRTVVGSGPYTLSKFLTGKMIILSKNKSWHGSAIPANKGKWNFTNIVFRFIREEANELLRMQKEDIDYMSLTPEAFETKTGKPPWGTKIAKVKTKNKSARGYGYIGFNLTNPLFQDQRVRKALAHLLNRELIRKKLHFGYGKLATGPWYSWSDYADPSVKPLRFDPKKANSLLKSAGWADRDKDGVLEKTVNGQTQSFSFTLSFANSDAEKYLTLYQEDLKKSGIRLSLKFIDWTSFVPMLDDRKFSAVMLGWGGGSIDVDPKQIWHSESARNKGHNFIGYSNPQVDALIDKGRKQLNREDRIKTFRQVYRLIAEDVPYIFFFNNQFFMYGLNHRVKTPKPTFTYFIGREYWSLTPGL